MGDIILSAFAVFGNPIKHSKSAEIYALFAREIGILEEYNLKLVLEEDFDSVLFNFFQSKGLGANITVPFKERAFLLCNCLTDRAKLARSVNTIKKIYNGDLLGDNTDGIGFINDLKRLNWISKNFIFIMNKEEEKLLSSRTINILLIGAGGAAKGIIPVLLTIPNCNVNIVNRTYSRAQALTKFYCDMGYKNIFFMSLDKLYCDNNKKRYHLIINATTSSIYNDIPKIPPSIISVYTRCYDLFYQKENTSFLIWCRQNGSKYCADGLGMLIEQAAYAFYLWHNVFPKNIKFVLSYLRSVL